MTLGLQGDDELLAQLLPSPTTTTTPVDHYQQSGGTGEPPASSCDGRRRRPRGSKRGRPEDDDSKSSSYNGEEPPRHHSCKTRRKKQRQKKMSTTTTTTTSSLVPDFDGYQWRKYGQKQIEGAMYARSYYRCTRSAEQGCPAKRTVQRNDDDGPAPKYYTVVYMGEHTCTANDSMEAPVILETTAAAVAATCSTSKRPQSHDDTAPPTTSDGSCSSTSTITTTGIIIDESPATSDITWSSCGGSGDYVVDDYCGLFGAHDSWALAPAAVSSLQEIMEDFTGPIRSPVHIAAADGWTVDHQFMLQLANEPVSHFSF
ncbi:putative WRKY transcription factor 58 [Panicum miliaceum]|uniref:WRKY transcription factor 58 n=1 Tax=Panicum miliaceum TaxID=4540 RepID=A0A3L6Q2S1_PANMI|nr:putative WRKY transcription factor 58 [Panicum miliaceum]